MSEHLLEQYLSSPVRIDPARREIGRQAALRRIVLEEGRRPLAQPERHHALDLRADAPVPPGLELSGRIALLSMTFDGVPQLIDAFSGHGRRPNDWRDPLGLRSHPEHVPKVSHRVVVALAVALV